MKKYLIYVITPGTTFGPIQPPKIVLHKNDYSGFSSLEDAKNYAGNDNYVKNFKYIIVDSEKLEVAYHNSF